MERREILRLGAVAGAIFIGEKIRPLQAATAAGAKPKTSAYSGVLKLNGQDLSLVFGVAHGRVSGQIYGDDTVYYSVTGTLKKGKLNLAATTYGEPDNQWANLEGSLKRGKYEGKVSEPKGFDFGGFTAARRKTDTKSMKSIAGDYEGIVSQGPGFIGNCQIKSDGTFRLYDVQDPNGKALGPMQGYYVAVKTPPSSESAGIQGAPLSLLFYVFALCKEKCHSCDDGDELGQTPNPFGIAIGGGFSVPDTPEMREFLQTTPEGRRMISAGRR